LSGYYNLLLFFLTLLFIIRPYSPSFTYLATWKLILTITLISAVFNSNHNRFVKWIAFLLAIPAVLFSWINLFHHESIFFVLNASFTILFMLLCTSSILYDVVLKARVTLETLRGVICAYFLVAFSFAYIYYLIEFILPNSFHLFSGISAFNYTDFLSEMLYFSFTTLVTIGYGDITAIKDVAQTASVIEAVIGQFYVAILVARLVSVYSMYADKKMVKKIEEDFDIKPGHKK
jgi:voltage-gated potassium channel